jgi:hypothetical protein
MAAAKDANAVGHVGHVRGVAGTRIVFAALHTGLTCVTSIFCICICICILHMLGVGRRPAADLCGILYSACILQCDRYVHGLPNLKGSTSVGWSRDSCGVASTI